MYELVAAVAVERAAAPVGCRLRTHLVRLLGGAHAVSVGQPLQLDRFAVRLPDIALAPTEGAAPAFILEIIRSDNTAAEVSLPLSEYAKAGVKLAWYVDPERKEVDICPKANPKRKRTLGVDDELDGGAVLPSFAVKVGKLFESRAPAKKPARKGKK